MSSETRRLGDGLYFAVVAKTCVVGAWEQAALMVQRDHGVLFGEAKAIPEIKAAIGALAEQAARGE